MGGCCGRTTAGAASHFTPAIDGVRAIFALEDSRAVALRLADGRTDWEQKLEGMLTQPSFVHDRVFVGSNKNFLYALTNDSGRLAWRWKTGGDVIGTSGDAKRAPTTRRSTTCCAPSIVATGISDGSRRFPRARVLPPQTFGDGMKYERSSCSRARHPRSMPSRRRTALSLECHAAGRFVS